MSSYSNKIKSTHSEVFDAIKQSKFMADLAAGTLPVEKYRYFVIQRYSVKFYLDKFLALGIAKFPYHFKQAGGECASTVLSDAISNPEPANTFKKIQQELKISDAELKPSPVAKGYADYLMNVGYGQGYKEVLVILVTMAHCYQEVCHQYQGKGGQNPLYKEFLSKKPNAEKIFSWAEKALDEVMGNADVTPKHKSVVQYMLQWQAAFLEAAQDPEKFKWPVEAKAAEHLT